MQRINTTDELFHDGDPFNGVQGTAVTAAWLNSIQEELANVIEAADIALSPGQSGQLLESLVAICSVGVTQAAGDRSKNVATDEFVHVALGGVAVVNVAGHDDIVLQQTQWGKAIVVLVGNLSADINVIVPNVGDQWIVLNSTTGGYMPTMKTAAGSGVAVSQGRSAQLFCDGANVHYAQTDALSVVGASAPVYIDQAQFVGAGAYLVDTTVTGFALTLPAFPRKGQTLTFIDAMGTWATNHLTISRNGKAIMGFAEDLLVDVADLQFSMWFNGTEWRLV